MDPREGSDERIRRFLIALAQHPEAETRMKRYPRPAAPSGCAEIALTVARELDIKPRVTKEELTRALEADAQARQARLREAEPRPLPDGDLKAVSGGRETVPEELQSIMEMLLGRHTETAAYETVVIRCWSNEAAASPDQAIKEKFH